MTDVAAGLRRVIIVLTITIVSIDGAHAASFDCDAKELKPDEKAICDNRALNDADVKMVTTFDLLSGLLAMGARGSMQDEQTAWLKTRQACGADTTCIKAAYDARLRQLDQIYKNINRPL
ncbi:MULTISPECIES: lysozyme inhibitor LprI family protein [unclassified Sinorhizobium]|uniref:lysozyme inhibitor LprI family protein n=1 Tax=unclassified Sinorhizobium TaxID=2613772 RepID=UPI00352373E4